MEILKVEELTDEYVDDVYNIEKELLGTGNISDIRASVGDKIIRYFVLLKENLVIGFLQVKCIPPEAEIYDIAIKKREQGNGYSKVLMNHLLEFVKKIGCRTIFLEVNKINRKAIGLYKKYGFNDYGERKNYYGNSDAILMKKEII